MADNQYANKIVINGVTKIDLTGDTVTAGDLRQGITSHGADGAPITGSLVVPDPPSGTLAITANGTYDVAQYASANVNVSSDLPKHGVIFVDYDGTVVDAWDSSEVAGKTALPANPSHTGLVAEGWNWSLAEIQSRISTQSNDLVCVGQLYYPSSGKLEFTIELTKKTGLEVDFYALRSIIVAPTDWGDGSVVGTRSHIYNDYGTYTIRMNITGNSLPSSIFGTTTPKIYLLKEAHIPSSITQLSTEAFSYCYNLEKITTHTGLTYIMSSFRNCRRLKCLVFPARSMELYGAVLEGCAELQYVSCPYSLYYGQVINIYAFYECFALSNVTIPRTIKQINSYAFQKCYNIKSIIFPASISTIAQAFVSLYSCTMYDFSQCTSVPTLSAAGVFNEINALCKIVVPDALYDDWIAATNWSTYADYIYKASEVTD